MKLNVSRASNDKMRYLHAFAPWLGLKQEIAEIHGSLAGTSSCLLSADHVIYNSTHSRYIGLNDNAVTQKRHVAAKYSLFKCWGRLLQELAARQIAWTWPPTY